MKEFVILNFLIQELILIKYIKKKIKEKKIITEIKNENNCGIITEIMRINEMQYQEELKNIKNQLSSNNCGNITKRMENNLDDYNQNKNRFFKRIIFRIK